LSLHDGRTVSGLFLRDDGAVLVLADSQGKEQRYEKSAVEERRISPVSPMPADVGTRLTQNELRDLIAFLHQQRTQPKKQP
jgi:putative heme-binding domain-containing protein